MPEETITVTWGEEHYQVTKYNGFRVGPFTYTTSVRVGETPEQAIKRAWDTLDTHANKLFVAKRNGYAERWAVRDK